MLTLTGTIKGLGDGHGNVTAHYELPDAGSFYVVMVIQTETAAERAQLFGVLTEYPAKRDLVEIDATTMEFSIYVDPHDEASMYIGETCKQFEALRAYAASRFCPASTRVVIQQTRRTTRSGSGARVRH